MGTFENAWRKVTWLMLALAGAVFLPAILSVLHLLVNWR
jgi:hypothetical protein